MSLYVDNPLAGDVFCRLSDSHASNMATTKGQLSSDILSVLEKER